MNQDAIEAAAQARVLRHLADSTRMPWTMFLRDDGTPVSVHDCIRELAEAIETSGVPR